MPEFELTFIVDHLDLDQDEIPLEAEFADDIMVGRNHSGEYYVIVTVEGPSAIDAAKDAHMRMCRHGVTVLRLEYDLADRREIAFRLEQTRQSVGHWIRGDRRTVTPFPTPFNEVGGGVWLWSDVVAWVREARGDDPMDGVLLPTREDITAFNAHVHSLYAPKIRTADDLTTVYTVLLGKLNTMSTSNPMVGADVVFPPAIWEWFDDGAMHGRRFAPSLIEREPIDG